MKPRPRNLTLRISNVDLSLEENARRVSVQSVADVLPVFAQIKRWMQGYVYPQIDRFAVSLALREAVLNAVQHGHAGDLTKLIRITYAVRPDEVVIEVEDQGTGYDPALVPNPLCRAEPGRPRGWGLFMMRAYMSWLAVDPPGNRVIFGRQRADG